MLERVRREAEENVRLTPDGINVNRALLSLLYWAEGMKFDGGGVNFANTDPRLAYLFITLLRKCYVIDEKRLRLRLHVHHYHNIKRVRSFWSKQLDIPESQIGRVFVKKRSKTKRFRKNFMGICFVRYSNAEVQRSILAHGYALQNYLAPISQKTG